MVQPVWDDERVGRWLGKLGELEAQMVPVSDALFAAAGLTSGLSVLDVGCGAGSTTRRAADLVGPDGSATGLDIAPAMIATARQQAGNRRIQWLTADLVNVELPAAAYDVIISRFGVMFFSDPPEAFGRLARSARPGGRLCMAVWQPVGRSPFFDVPYAVVAAALRTNNITFVDQPSPASSLGDPQRTAELLGAAGWTDISFEVHDESLYLAGPASLAVGLEAALDHGPVRTILEGQPTPVIELARAALAAELTPRHDGTGIPLPGGYLIVSANRG